MLLAISCAALMCGCAPRFAGHYAGHVAPTQMTGPEGEALRARQAQEHSDFVLKSDHTFVYNELGPDGEVVGSTTGDWRDDNGVVVITAHGAEENGQPVSIPGTYEMRYVPSSNNHVLTLDISHDPDQLRTNQTVFEKK